MSSVLSVVMPVMKKELLALSRTSGDMTGVGTVPAGMRVEDFSSVDAFSTGGKYSQCVINYISEWGCLVFCTEVASNAHQN